MAWYFIILIILGYLIIGVFIAPIFYRFKGDNMVWGVMDFVMSSMFWPILVIFLIFAVIGWIAMQISKWLFPNLRIDE